MRGKGHAWGAGWGGNGITPAYAGKSPFQKMVTQQKRDHPRVCGEKPDRQRPRARP